MNPDAGENTVDRGHVWADFAIGYVSKSELTRCGKKRTGYTKLGRIKGRNAKKKRKANRK